MASAWRPPEAYIHGIDGPVVVVNARVAALLHDRHGLGRLRSQIRGQDAELDSALVAIGTLAAHWRSSAIGSDQVPTPELAAPWVSTSRAAGLIGISSRAVVAAIRAGRLPAEMVDGRYRIARLDVEHYRAQRAARAA